MGVCANLAKCVLAVINVILWATAVVLIFIAGWVGREFISYRSNLLPVISSTLLPVVIVFVAGLLLFVFVAVGCVALLKENKCLLGLFFVFLLILFLAFLSGFVASVFCKEQFDENIYAELRNGINKYNTDLNKQDYIDLIQSEVSCCGVDNYTDWVTTSWFNASNPNVAYPASCCRHGACHYGDHPDRNLNEKGCYGEVKLLFSKHFVVFVSSATGCSLLVVLGMICSCVLLCQGRRRCETRHYVGLTDAEEAE